MQLYFNLTHRIPTNCVTRNVYAEIELWHRTLSNQWLYILSKPTAANILCHSSNDAEETLQGIGTIQIENDCKIYTDTTILEIETTTGPSNIMNKIPLIPITEDDCCIKVRNNVTMNSLQLQPLKLNNVNLDELKYAQQKLHEVDSALKNHMNQTFLQKHSGWFTTIFTIVVTGISLLIMYRILRWFGFFSIIYRFISCTNQTPRNSSIPCVQVFTHCFNKPTPNRTELNVHYEAECQSLDNPTEEQPAFPRYFTRRSNHSKTSADNQQPTIKITSQ